MTAIVESLRLDQFPFVQVARWLSEGAVVPFIGAGGSRVGISPEKAPPDGRGLAGELASHMEGAYAYNATEDLAKVAQVYQNIVFDREALYAHLHNRFEVDQRQNVPSDVATMLANIPRNGAPLFLITTNYDSFIERAFHDANKPICVISQDMRNPSGGASALSLILPDGRATSADSTLFQWNDRQFPSDCAFLFKIHGTVKYAEPNGLDDVIITEDDYVDFLVNSGGNASPYFPPASLTAAYKQRRFLFLGYSLRDWNFRAFLRMLTLRNAVSGREARRHWAIQLEAEQVEVDLWRHRNVNVHIGDLSEFCKRLQQVYQEAS